MVIKNFGYKSKSLCCTLDCERLGSLRTHTVREGNRTFRYLTVETWKVLHVVPPRTVCARSNTSPLANIFVTVITIYKLSTRSDLKIDLIAPVSIVIEHSCKPTMPSNRSILAHHNPNSSVVEQYFNKSIFHKYGTRFADSNWPRRLLEHCYFKKKKKYSPITVSSKQPGSFKLFAAPLPPKKIVFGVGKLKSSVKEEILEHLETIGLTAAECVPVFKFSPTRPQSSTSDPSTKFHITIFKHQEMIFTNPENWLIGVEIYPWWFHALPQHTMKPTTTSLPNHYPVDRSSVNKPSLVNSHRHVENTVEVASILTSSEESTQPVESVMMGPSQLVEPHKQQQASSTMGPPSDVNSILRHQ
ncbi:hypothetical protein HELRODRAFT_178457 [Helobdella robusta]|uniref:Uncharacterized protein n=1 Tax=Helobdella robusta TaxID=6412 RepID=T1FD68_HELRO|nr:hypothetical protein HELRODRAFT_178457 [Helobdella robusta]ESN97015.1 hypothetical protein HELRODRAFT_178457 [Helobdella robusta]